MKYLDMVVEDVDRIDTGRLNLNRTIYFLFGCWLFFMCFSMILYLINYFFSAIFMSMFAVSYLILISALVVKREIYSLAILIKKSKEDG